MASFRIDSLASLSRQLGFAPTGKRLAQLAAAEDLLLRIESDRGYPVGYVIHAITGFRPKAADVEDADLLPGEALQHDLGLLIETVSDAMDLPAMGAGEPVLGIEDVCTRFGVTSKTIQRWRRRGLPARRFLFADGKKRVGFRLSCVERFIARQGSNVPLATAVDPLDTAERDECLRRARHLASAGHCRNEITRRVARRLGRSSLAVLHTLDHHERLSGEVIVAGAANPISADTAARVLSLAQEGFALSGIARELGLDRTCVYRTLIEARAERLESAGVRYHDDALYHAEEAEGQIAQMVRDAERALTARADAIEQRIPRGLPPYLAALYRTPLLSAELERALFLQFNFHKCRFAQLRGLLDPHLCRRRDLDALERHLRLARHGKNRIVTANLRLVVSVARKHLRGSLDLMELVSDGNIVLMRAVEGFDVHRGFRFSTYATLALMKGFARSVPELQSATRLAAGRRMEELAARDEAFHRTADRDQLNTLLGRLDEYERQVVSAHYGLDEGRPEGTTLEHLSRALGVTRHRVRQIEQSALSKLRRYVETSSGVV